MKSINKSIILICLAALCLPGCTTQNNKQERAALAAGVMQHEGVSEVQSAKPKKLTKKQIVIAKRRKTKRWIGVVNTMLLPVAFLSFVFPVSPVICITSPVIFATYQIAQTAMFGWFSYRFFDHFCGPSENPEATIAVADKVYL